MKFEIEGGFIECKIRNEKLYVSGDRTSEGRMVLIPEISNVVHIAFKE